MSNRVTITEGWPATPTITASGDTVVRVQNTDRAKFLFFAITEDDTPPDFETRFGHYIYPAYTMGRDWDSMTLKPPQRLWMASDDGPMTITITTGSA